MLLASRLSLLSAANNTDCTLSRLSSPTVTIIRNESVLSYLKISSM